MTKARDQQRDREGQQLDQQKLEIQNKKQEAQDEYEEIKKHIADDDEFRANLAKIEAEKEAAEEEKVKEKMSMDEAARFI